MPLAEHQLSQLWTQRWKQLETDRSSWVTHWQEIKDHLLPRAGRFMVTDRNETGQSDYNKILDNTGTRSLRVLGAGMMAGATSPARPWFRLVTTDPDLNEFHEVRVWLADVVRRMERVFAKSNTYRVLHNMYEELGAFGTAVSVVAPSFDTVIHHYPVTVGEFCLATDFKGRVTTMYRELERTVAEVVKEFGIDAVSESTRSAFKQGKNLGGAVRLLHVIEPRADRDHTKIDSLNMPWESAYLEMGQEDNKILRRGGFQRFPVLAPRWGVNTGDIYGHSPGMEVLGDIISLQHEQLRKGQAIDYQTKPPLQVPTQLANRDREGLPGGVQYYNPGDLAMFDQTTPNAGIRTMFDVNLELGELREDILDVRDRIRSGFFADLFLMLANAGPNTRMTATEVAERHEEKLLMLGPVLERLHNELLEPLVDLTFEHMLDAGLLQPPPEELQGHDLSVEFVSILAQAQRAIGTNSIDRFVGNLSLIAQMKPEVLDKFDVDHWADSYASMLGVDPHIIVPQERVDELREARAQAQAAQEQAAMMEQQAKTARDLSQAPTAGEPTVLTDFLSQGEA